MVCVCGVCACVCVCVCMCVCVQTSVCRDIVDQLGQLVVNSQQRRVVMVSQDSFYRNLTPTEKAAADRGEFNFDHPGMARGA